MYQKELLKITELDNCEEMKCWKPIQGELETSPKELEELLRRPFARCSPEEVQQLRLLIQYSDVFAMTENRLGQTNIVEHEIHTDEARPTRQAPRRVPIHKVETGENIGRDERKRSH